MRIGPQVIAEASLLLDTHVWLWSQLTPERLRPSVQSAITKAAGRNAIFIAVISIWEVALLDRSNRIHLQADVTEWCRRALRKPGTNLLGFTPEIAIDSVNLPAPMHKDPADRILIASARMEGLTLVTADKPILDYANVITLPCLKA